MAELFIGLVALHQHCPPQRDPFPLLAHGPVKSALLPACCLVVFLESNIVVLFA